MLKFINLKKLTAKALFGVLIIGSFIAVTSNKKALADACSSNNGHGNNAPFTHKISTGKLIIGQYDPTNPGNVQNQLKADLEAGKTVAKNGGGSYYITFISNGGTTTSNNANNIYSLGANSTAKSAKAVEIIAAHPDWEIKGNGANATTTIEVCNVNDRDNDSINDAVELGSNFNTPLDTDGDSQYDYEDTDSDNDGVLDSVEGIVDTDGDGISNYIDAIDNTPLTLTGTIRDFTQNHPDFEKTVGTDKGIVTTQLGADKKPVYAKATGGTLTTSGKANFDQWYRDVSGVNQSKEYSIQLAKQNDGTYKYTNNSFFPINGQLLGNYSNTGKNYHFTYEIHTKFTYVSGQTFNFSGDDDVWVYINGQRVIDLGGVHTTQNQTVNLNTLGLTAGQTYDLDFFFAERHYSESNFTITTNIALQPALNPDGDQDNDTISNSKDGITSDSDGDGIKDYLDTDSDNNTILDKDEVGNANNPADMDNDGTANFKDLDDDNDGINDSVDGITDSSLDTDTDPNFRDTDSDGDTLPDSGEGSNDSTLDTDTDPNFLDLDSDGDTLPDSGEGSNDSTLDIDTDPNFLDLDSDGDNIPDKNEKFADANGDGHGYDIEDSNGDGEKNADDLTAPKTLDDVDGDGKKNYLDDDSDGDIVKDNVDPTPYIPQTD